MILNKQEIRELEIIPGLSNLWVLGAVYLEGGRS